MTNFFITFSAFSDTLGLFVALLATVLFKSQQFTIKNRKIIFIYFFAYCILSLYGNIYPFVFYWFRPLYFSNSNNWLYDNIPLILTVILYVFFYSLSTSKTGKILCKLSFLLLVVFYLLTWKNAFNKEQNLEYYLIYTIFVILNSLMFLIAQVNEINTVSLFDKGEFWFISSIVFYTSSCSIFWVFYKDIYTLYPTMFNLDYLWFCHNIILFISCLFYSLAIYLKTRPSR